LTTTFQTNLQLDAQTRAQLVDMLNMALAETSDLYFMTKQAHWNVRGPFFFARHELFDKVAGKRLGYIDALAERVGTLGGYAEGSLRWAAENTQLKAYDREAVSGTEHVRNLANRYASYCAHVRKWIEVASELDPATEDLLTEILRETELDLWFLESHVQG
tara:strand:- start:69 stop:551 length:483 start_codon:yes stop_codon:yes gene_type:complete